MVAPDSKTAKNLLAAFAGESQARNKYTFYAEAAKAEGLETTADLFTKLAKNEEQHAKFWFKYIRESFSNTEENLEDAIAGEHNEWTDMYMNFALQAKDEGYDELAVMFERVAGIERNHEKKLNEVLGMLRGEEEKQAGQKGWLCEVCGHIVYGDEAPDQCPVCKAKGCFIREE